MHAGFATFHDVGGFQLREVLEPEAGGLCLSVPKLPRLDYLVWLADAAADDGYGVL